MRKNYLISYESIEVKKMSSLKFIRWNDALKHYKNLLDEAVQEGKKVNTAYQKYLKANPHKKEKFELKAKRKKYTDRILELIDEGYERYTGK